MREILFRGKRTDNGEWVYGFPFSYQVILFVEGIETLIGDRHRIDPSTVGQYTGLTDKNGKRIFEGDLLLLATGRTCEVMFADGSFYMNVPGISIRHVRRFTIVGNRWDNPELL